MKSGQRLYRLDIEKIHRLRIQRGLTEQAFAIEAGIPSRTRQRIFRGEACMMKIVTRIAEFFEIQDPTEILHPLELETNGHLRVNGRGRLVGDWEAAQPMGPWETASNSLQWRLYRMAHLHLPERLGRGKCYDLGQLSDCDREALAAQLQRHPDVCGRIGQHPNVAINLTALPDPADRNWWVVDQWVEGRTLSALFVETTFDRGTIITILRGIADGLAALHEQAIVRRELAPQFVLVRTMDQTPILTDFELAKLLDTDLTVSNKHYWQTDPFRAPEVTAGGDVDVRADIYSWGRIAAQLVAGELPKAGDEEVVVSELRIPKGIGELIVACTQLPRSKRPADMASVQRELRTWK
ncbi:MAG: protein kinase [Pirellulales bacterium]|nr:protein kinase [Pirellulales bacterium]